MQASRFLQKEVSVSLSKSLLLDGRQIKPHESDYESLARMHHVQFLCIFRHLCPLFSRKITRVESTESLVDLIRQQLSEIFLRIAFSAASPRAALGDANFSSKPHLVLRRRKKRWTWSITKREGEKSASLISGKSLYDHISLLANLHKSA